MMQKKDQKLIEAFIEKARTIPSLRGAVLFGSMARGDYDRRSDIDILLVIDDPRPQRFLRQVVHMISELRPHREIQVTLTNLKDRDGTFLRNVFKEGRILFGTFLISPDGAALTPYLLIAYDLAGKKPVVQVRVSRMLHGYRSKKNVNGALKEYWYKGLREAEGARIVSQGTILLPAEEGNRFMKTLDALKVKRTATEVYL